MQYVPELTWLLFLRVLDDQEQASHEEADAVGSAFTPSLQPPYRWRDWASPWIPERSATRLREADLNILSKLGKQGLEWRLEPEAFAGREVGREDDLLDVLVGCPVDIEVARQPSA